MECKGYFIPGSLFLVPGFEFSLKLPLQTS